MSLSCEVYPDTPEGSEVDELEYANGVAEWLFYLSYTYQVSDEQFVDSVNWLDTIPGAGEYFRCMCSQEYSDDQLNTWVWFGVQVRMQQWVKKGKDFRYQKVWR